ncbi:hypothetical protein ACQEUX_11970 [Micromonospora sp. CA-259024]|uniref:hypothetical protein n=1 Tax=Micromonospora sp. CA-259024 TaxID=3239965 RepID=UPI003D8C5797
MHMQPEYFVDRDRVFVLRRADLLWLELELVRCRLSDDGTTLERIQVPSPPRVNALFPFQHLLEEPVGDGLLHLPVRSLAAAPTKLSFAAPTGPLPPGGLLAALDRWPYDAGSSMLEFPARLRLRVGSGAYWSLGHPASLAEGPDGTAAAGLWQGRLSRLQEGWRRCAACQTLVFPGDTTAICQTGQAHRYAPSTYSLRLGGWIDGEQPGWYRCGRCQGLFFSGFGDGRCRGNQTHIRTEDYSVAIASAPPGAEIGWRWCSYCQVLFYMYAPSLCVNGRPHYPHDSNWYTVVRGPSTGGTAVVAEAARDGDTPFDMSPTPQQLHHVVNGMFDVTAFALSPLGASVRMAGPIAYQPEPVEDPGIDYEHHAEFGRDVRVRVTQRGYLSTRNEASIVTLTERRIGYRWVPVVPAGNQALWDWCGQCGSLSYGGGIGGRCVDGNPHRLGGDPGKMVPLGSEPFPSDPGWAWCAVCESLTQGGVCWSGAAHQTAGSGRYSVKKNLWATAFPLLATAAHRCDRCGRLVQGGGLCVGGVAHDLGDFAYAVDDRGMERVSFGYLHRSSWLVVTQPEVPCGSLGQHYIFDGREMPLRRLRLRTLRVPLDEQPPGDVPFWVRAGGGDVEFAIEAVDWEERAVAFSMPLVFVPEASAADGQAASRVYAEGPQWRRTRPFGGQVVAVANPVGACGGPTAVPVTAMNFQLQPATAVRPAFLLGVAGFAVTVESLSHFDPAGAAPVDVVLHDKYTAHGMGAGNPTGAYLQLVRDVGVAFAAHRVGGLASPNTVLGAVSARRGVIPRGFSDGTPSPDLGAIFGDAKLLGIVPFRVILDSVPEPPTMITRRVGDTIQIEYALHAALKSGVRHRSLSFGTAATLDLRAITSTSALGAATGQLPQSHVEGTVTDMSLSVGNVVTVRFAKLRFVADAGRNPQIDIEGCEVSFHGELKFVGDLADALSSFGFGSGTSVTVTPAGIEIGYTAAIPSAAVGVFNLSNLVLSTGLTLPFTGAAPQLRFGFSHRDDPFTVGVLFLAGGGFFALTVDGEKGVTRVEAALEFGGNCEVDVVVARGGVYAMVGIYLALTNGVAVISGYVRCGGYLDILGIVSISVDFRMELRYSPTTGEVVGSATLTVGISVLFFSKSLTFSVERRFAGSAPAARFSAFAAAGPALPAGVDVGGWDLYCQAFV